MVSFTTCSGISDLLGGGDDDAPAIPEGVLELAGGVFDLIGMVFESDYSDPTDDPTYPTGMTVSWITEPTVLKITLADFTPPDDPGGPVVNGSVMLTETVHSPLTLTFQGTLAVTNCASKSVALTGTAVWASGADPGNDDPQSVTGTSIWCPAMEFRIHR